MEDEPNLCGLLGISELYHYKTVQPEIMLLVLRLSRLLLKSLTTLCAYGNFALHKIVPQYVLSPSAYVHSHEVCRRRRRAATVVRSCVVDDRRSLSKGVNKGGGAGVAIAPPYFGRIEGAAGKRRCAVLLLAPPTTTFRKLLTPLLGIRSTMAK